MYSYKFPSSAVLAAAILASFNGHAVAQSVVKECSSAADCDKIYGAEKHTICHQGGFCVDCLSHEDCGRRNSWGLTNDGVCDQTTYTCGSKKIKSKSIFFTSDRSMIIFDHAVIIMICQNNNNLRDSILFILVCRGIKLFCFCNLII